MILMGGLWVWCMTSRWCVQSPTTSGDVARDQVCREGQTQSGQAGRSGRRKGRQRESYPITESDLERLDDGEAITVRPDGWLRGHSPSLMPSAMTSNAPSRMRRRKCVTATMIKRQIRSFGRSDARGQRRLSQLLKAESLKQIERSETGIHDDESRYDHSTCKHLEESCRRYQPRCESSSDDQQYCHP